MKQILQNISNGETQLVEVPCPLNASGNVLVATSRTLVSLGTERMLVEFGNANWFEKANQQPDNVRVVFDKVKTDGLLPTYEAIKTKLDQPLPLGYCNAGVVLQSGVEGFSVGDRVVSNGYHAEVVRVAKNLCARIPDSVTLAEVGPKTYVNILQFVGGRDIKVLSNNQIVLGDGTPAYRTDIKWWFGSSERTTHVVSVFKDGKWVYLAAHPRKKPNNASDIFESLRFELSN